MLFDWVQWARALGHVRDPFQVIGWSYATQAADALRTLVDTLRFGYSWAAPGMLRMCRESRIGVTWLLADPSLKIRNERAARILTRGMKLGARSDILGAADVATASKHLLGALNLSKPTSGREPPDIRQMANEANEPELYEAYKAWSSGMHTGVGSLFAASSIARDATMLRSEALLLAVEDVQNLLQVLLPTIASSSLQLAIRSLNSFDSIYYRPFQRGFWSVHAQTLAQTLEGRKELLDPFRKTHPVEIRPGVPLELAGSSALHVDLGRLSLASVQIENQSVQTLSTYAVGLRPKRRITQLGRRWRHPIDRAPTNSLVPGESIFVSFRSVAPKGRSIHVWTEDGLVCTLYSKPVTTITHRLPTDEIELLLRTTSTVVRQPGPCW